MPDAAILERIRAGYAAFFDGDLDAVGALMAEDVVGYDAPEMPDSAEHRGRDALTARLAGFRELFDDIEPRRIAVDELGEQVLVVLQVSAHAHSTGIPVELELAYLLDIRDGLIATIRAFLAEPQARAFAAAP